MDFFLLLFLTRTIGGNDADDDDHDDHDDPLRIRMQCRRFFWKNPAVATVAAVAAVATLAAAAV